MTMPMKRRISKARDILVSDTAVKIFEQMRQTRCSCSSPDDWIHNRECAGCRRWHELHAHLHRALQLKLWQYPAIYRSGPLSSLPVALQAASARRTA
jgi:hypothetical protein